MKKSFKVVSLGVATLSGLILNEVKTSSVAHADTVNNAAVKNNNIAYKVTDKDISDAQKKVNDSKKDVDSANKKVDQSQNKVDQQTKDINNYQNQKPTEPKAIQNSEKVRQQLNQAKAQENTAQDNVNQAKTALQNAQTKVAEQQTKVDQAQSNVTNAQNNVAQAQQAVNTAKNTQVVENHMAVSQSYINAAKKFTDEHNKAVENYVKNSDKISYEEATKNTGMQNPDFAKTMQKVSDDSYPLSRYQSNEQDKHVNVDLDHMTNEQNQELSKYAMDLLNDVRTQVGSPKLVLNQDAIDMAQDVAKGYIADGRSINDGKHHDERAINQVAKKYDLIYTDTDKTSGFNQYYENMAGFLTNAKHVENPQTANQDGFYMVDKSINHIVTMDYLKKNVYSDIKRMIYADDEWNHAFGLLEQADYNYDLPAYGYNKTPKFGLSLSVLPNSNYVSTHYIIIDNYQNQSKKHFNTDTDLHLKSASQKHDEYVQDLSKKVENANIDLTNAENALANEKNTLTNDQKILTNLQQQLANKQKALDIAKQNTVLAQQALENAETAAKLHNKDQQIYVQALNRYNSQMKEKKQDLAKAQADLAKAKSDLETAKNKLKSDTDNLNNLQNIQNAQKIAEESQKHNQDHDNTTPSDDHKSDTSKDNHQDETPVDPSHDNTTPSDDHKSDTSKDNHQDITPAAPDKDNTSTNDNHNSSNQSDNSVDHGTSSTSDQSITNINSIISSEDAAKPEVPSDVNTANDENKTKTIALTHNAYVYNDQGVAIKENDTIVKLLADTNISAWNNGKVVLIENKLYYQIGKNQYVKVANTVRKIELTHNAYIYDKAGNVAKKNGAIIKLFTGSKISAWYNGKVVTLNGKKFYQIGEDEFVKVANTVVKKHTKIKLTHNARVYIKKHGKVVKKRILKKGKILKAMRNGRTVIINGKQYYQIAKNEYIKVGNASLVK